MFAIHYFFASAKALDCFLHNVAINLKEGIAVLSYICLFLLLSLPISIREAWGFWNKFNKCELWEAAWKRFLSLSLQNTSLLAARKKYAKHIKLGQTTYIKL